MASKHDTTVPGSTLATNASQDESTKDTNNIASQAAAALKVMVVEGADQKPVHRPMITVRPAGTLAGNPLTLSENPGLFMLQPGDYDVTVRTSDESETAPRQVTITENQTTDFLLDITQGELELSLTAGGNPLIRAPTTQFRYGDQILGSAKGTPVRFHAISGTYQARIQLMGGQFFDLGNFEIKAGATNVCTMDLPCAQLSVTVSGGAYGGSGARLPYIELDQNSRLITALTANPARFQVLSGAYEVFVREADRRLGLQEIKLEPGQNLEIEINLAVP